MIVILEGMDKVGKTSLAKHFIDIGFKYVHLSAPPKDFSRETYLYSILKDVFSDKNKPVLYDRSWYGELIWPSIYNRDPILSKEDIDLIDRCCVLHHQGQYLKIYMHDDNEEAHKQRLASFKEPSYDYRKVKDIYENITSSNEFIKITFNQVREMGWISNKD